MNGEWRGSDSIGELVEAMHATSSEETSIREFKKVLSDKSKERIMYKREKGFMSLAFDDYIADHREEFKEEFEEEFKEKYKDEIKEEVKAEVRDEILAENKEKIREEAEKVKAEIEKVERAKAKEEATKEIQYKVNNILDSLLASGVNIPDDLLCSLRENTPTYNKD